MGGDGDKIVDMPVVFGVLDVLDFVDDFTIGNGGGGGVDAFAFESAEVLDLTSEGM